MMIAQWPKACFWQVRWSREKEKNRMGEKSRTSHKTLHLFLMNVRVCTKLVLIDV